MDIKQLSDVFKTVGLPPYTYVKPAYYGEVRADITQQGKHLLIEGPSGIGKTCVVYKVFEELSWEQNDHYLYVSCRDDNATYTIDGYLSNATNGTPHKEKILVIDDFHLLSGTHRSEIGSRLKRLSDQTFETTAPPKVILIGIPTSGVSLLADSFDLGPRLGTYVLTRATDREIDRLITEGENALNVIFDDREVLLAESAGNFWLAQYICNKVCAMQEVKQTESDIKILSFDLLGIRQRLMTELSQRYMRTARTFAKGKKWRPGGGKPYLEVLLALCKIPDSVITFDKILNVVPERRRPGIKGVRPRIAEVIYDADKSIDLRKQIAFDPEAGFSIEDPLFRYFLTNLDAKLLFRDLGIGDENVEKGRLYAYDVGFSFAGEARKIAEAVNIEMKSEDVITFYDYDQQAFLLALDLEETLARIYKESCRYYLIFMDTHYKQKVWTRFEKDVLTRSNRKNHIIPVLLDDSSLEATLGISSSIGRIDLRDIWSEFKKTSSFDKDAINALRNRCVLPILEKIDAESDVV